MAQVDYYQLFDQIRFRYTMDGKGTWQEIELNPWATLIV